jgi:signal transduction histidine kinase
MSSAAESAPADGAEPAGQSVWPTITATAFVLVALLALAFIPMWASSRIQSLRTEIDVVAQPTHPLATRLQYMVARQAASIRAFALIGDSVSLQRFRDARAFEQEIAYQLRPLAARLNPALAASLERMEDARAAWHVLADGLAAGRVTRAEYVGALDRQLVLYRAVIDSSEALNAALEQETQRRREEIRAIEERHYRLSILLALSGLVAAGAVGWLSRRERLFALHNAELVRSSWRSERRWRLLADAGTIFTATRDITESARDLARLIVRRVASWCTIDVFNDSRKSARVAAAHQDPAKEPLLWQLEPAATAFPDAARRIRAGETLIGPRPDPPDAQPGAADAGNGVAAGSLMAAPLVSRGTTLGVITLGSAEHTYSGQDGDLLVELARRTALAIDNVRLYEEAVAASTAKSEFLAVMSHELRTPLTAVIGYADLLELQVAGELGPGQLHQIARIKVAARHLLQIIDEILSFSRIDAEPLALERVRLSELADDAAAIIRPLAEQKGLEFSTRAPEAQIVTDPVRARRVLVNLLTNAISFTPRGSVVLHVEVDDTHACFHVTDTGIGMAPADLERVFDPFWQVAPANTREVGGVGLGLSVTRALAVLLGGRIDAVSTPGQGSTFTLRVPLNPDGTWVEG